MKVIPLDVIPLSLFLKSSSVIPTWSDSMILALFGKGIWLFLLINQECSIKIEVFTAMEISSWCSVVVGYQPWRWRHHGPPKRRYLTTTLHGATTQEIRNSIKTFRNYHMTSSPLSSCINRTGEFDAARNLNSLQKCAGTYLCQKIFFQSSGHLQK